MAPSTLCVTAAALALNALPLALCATGASCHSQNRRFFTTGEPGDREGFECLPCPKQRSDAYRVTPNDHPPAFTEPELFVLDYWDAMTRGDLEWLLGSYAGSGTLIRAGGPPMSGTHHTDAGLATPWNGSRGYDAEADKGGLIRFFYSTGNARWKGSGGAFSNTSGTDGLHVAIQDIVRVSHDFAIITCIINGTQYSRTTGLPLSPWTSMKQSITVRNFRGDIGWKIVHFTCSWYAYAFLGQEGTKCMPGTSTGIPPPHVDWVAEDEYAVKFTDQADYCSSRCLCGEAPRSEHKCDEVAIPSHTDYRSDFFLTSLPAAAPGGFCLPCPISGRARHDFHEGSPEHFALSFLQALGAGNEDVARLYSAHAVLVRNGGPAITGPPSAGAETGHGLEFFTHLWPGLTYVGSGGATQEMHIALHRTLRVGGEAAQVLVLTNGTLYSKSTGEVAVPWMAKRIALSLVREGPAWARDWKVVSLAAMDYNTNGVSRCTYDGIPANNSYCLTRCPCGELVPLNATAARAESVSYHFGGHMV